MVYILDGQAEVTIDNMKHTVSNGEIIVMPANVPHGLFASEPFKMLLIVVFKLN
jgi:quercetin dioxygenase-like cupin family protein